MDRYVLISLSLLLNLGSIGDRQDSVFAESFLFITVNFSHARNLVPFFARKTTSSSSV